MAYRGGPYGSGTNRPAKRKPAPRASFQTRAHVAQARVQIRQPKVARPVRVVNRSGTVTPIRNDPKTRQHRVSSRKQAKHFGPRTKAQKAAGRRVVRQAAKRARVQEHIARTLALYKRNLRFNAAAGVDAQHNRSSALQSAMRGEDIADSLHIMPQRPTGAINETFDSVVGRPVRAAEKAGSFALAQTTRPLHAIAGGAYAAVKGRSLGHVFEDAGKGFVANPQKPGVHTFSDVLGEAGVTNKTVRGIAGFGLDVAGDPTTYLTFGGSAAAKGLTKAAEKKVTREATGKALESGASREEAAHVARTAVSLASRDARPVRGVTVGMRALGREVKTSGRASRAIGRKTRAAHAGQRVRETRAVQTGGELLRPGFRPKHVPQHEWDRVRRAERTSRAMQYSGHRAAQDRAVAYHRALQKFSKKERAEIIDAVETGRHLKDPEAQTIAEAIRADLAHAHGAELRSGLLGSRLENYFPHKLKGKLLPGGKRLPAGKRAELESSRARTRRDTLKNLKAQGYDEFSDEIPLVMGARLTQSATARSNAHLVQELNSTGRQFGLGATRKEGEAVYEVSKRTPPRKLSKQEVTELLNGIKDKGARDAFEGKDIRILNEHLVNRVVKAHIPPEGAIRTFGRFYDRQLQGKFKTLVTVPNPQYHLTNLYGDLFNSYLADTRFFTGLHGYHSARALKRLSKKERVRKALGQTLDPTNKGLKIRGQKVTYDELIDEAEKVGAIRTGFIGRDLPEVLDSMAKETAERVGKGRFARKIPGGGRVASSKIGRPLTHPLDAIRNASQYREDMVRLATYIEGRKRGMTPSAAAEHVSKFHFDYGDLTDFERTVMRRAAPFYTFTARNFPLQVGTLIRRPGKYANLQKIREEAQRDNSNLPRDWESQLEDYQQRGQPIPIPDQLKPAFRALGVKGDFILAKLPSTDLGRLAPDLREQFNYTFQMLSPFITTPVEYAGGYSFFFREPIDALSEQSGGAVQDYTAAPAWLAESTKAVFGERGLRAMGMRKAPLRKGSTEQVWVWPKKFSYLYGKLGPAAATAGRIGSGENQAGQGTGEALFGFLTGLKVSPFDTKKINENQLFKERDRLDALSQLLRREGKDRTKDGAYTHQYRQTLDRLTRINRRLFPPETSGGSGGSPVLQELDRYRSSGSGGSSALEELDRLRSR